MQLLTCNLPFISTTHQTARRITAVPQHCHVMRVYSLSNDRLGIGHDLFPSFIIILRFNAIFSEKKTQTETNKLSNKLNSLLTATGKRTVSISYLTELVKDL